MRETRQGPSQDYLFSHQFPGGMNYRIGSETELLLQFFQRRRRAECVHADDAALRPDILRPGERGSLLHRHTCGNFGWKDLLAIALVLVLEDVPGGHADYAR